MKSSQLLSVAALAGTSTAAKVVSQQFHKIKQVPPNVHITKRDNLLNVTAINNITGGGYYAEMEVGTPPQTVVLHLDTGSSDTWVVAEDADLCGSARLQEMYASWCMDTFDPDDSSSFETVDSGGFDIQYLDGRRIRGDYFTDDVTIGGQTVESQQLGLGLNTSRGAGLIGLGLGNATASRRGYSTLLDSMVEQGLIGRRAFSVWLNDVRADDGDILFGGVDPARYYGQLSTLPIIPTERNQNFLSHYTVPLSSVALHNGTDGSDDDDDDDAEDITSSSFTDGRGILDTGSTLTLVPEDVAQALFEAMDVVLLDIGVLDCAWAGPRGEGLTVDFNFGGSGHDSGADAPETTIHVPLRELVLDNLGTIVEGLGFDLEDVFPGFEGLCMFGIQPNTLFGVEDTGFVLLGDTFLRSAYVVYDEANMQVGLAQAVMNATASSEDDLVELEEGQTALPTASGRDPAEATERISAGNGGSGSGGGGGGSGSGGTENGDDDDDSAASVLGASVSVALAALVGAVMVAV